MQCCCVTHRPSGRLCLQTALPGGTSVSGLLKHWPAKAATADIVHALQSGQPACACGPVAAVPQMLLALATGCSLAELGSPARLLSPPCSSASTGIVHPAASF